MPTLTSGVNATSSISSSSSSSTTNARVRNREQPPQQDEQEGERQASSSSRRIVQYAAFDVSDVALPPTGSFVPNGRFHPISISALEDDDESRRSNPKLMFRFVDLQLLRIICGSSGKTG